MSIPVTLSSRVLLEVEMSGRVIKIENGEVTPNESVEFTVD